MSQACSLVTILVMMMMMVHAKPDPQFDPFQFTRQFMGFGNNFGYPQPNMFIPQPSMFIPQRNPYVPDYAHVFGKVGSMQGVTNGGGVFQASTFGLGGDRFQEKSVVTMTGPDGTYTKLYNNKNGVEDVKEIIGKPKGDKNGFGNSVFQSSSFGYEGGNFENTMITYETGPDGKTVAKVSKNKNGEVVEKEISL